MTNDQEWKTANELIRKANEYTQISLFQWEPRWDKAALSFEQAAKKYQKLGSGGVLEAIQAYKDASHAHKQMNSINAAAKDMEMAALLESKIPNQEESAMMTYQQVADLYEANGQTYKAVTAYLTAADLAMKINDTEHTSTFLLAACDLVERSQLLQGVDTFKRSIDWFLQSEQYADAMFAYDRLSRLMASIGHSPKSIYRNYLCVIVIALAVSDIDMAFNCFQRYADTDGWLQSDEASLANELLIAYDDADEERLRQTLRHSTFVMLERHVARLASSLQIKHTDHKDLDIL